MKSKGAVGLLVAIGLLTGTAQAMAKTRLTHYFWVAAGPAVLDMLKDRAKDFEKQNPGVQVDFVQHSDWDKVLVPMAAGKPPDVFDCYIGGVAKFVQAGLLTDLAPYMKRDRIDPNSIIDSVMESFKYKGTIFGFPWGYGTVGVLYHVKPVAEAGLASPNSLQAAGNWNWSTLAEYGKKLTKDTNADGKPDIWGIGSSLQTGRYPMWVHQAGEPLFNAYLGPSKSNFNSNAAKTGMKWFSDLYLETKVATPDWTAINRKKAIMGIDAFAGTHIPFIPDMAKNPIDIVEEPKGPANAGSFFSANALHIPRGSKNKELAWKWIKFITLGVENQRRWMSTGGKPSPFKGMMEEYAKRPGFPEHVGAYVKMAEDSNTKPIYDSPLKDFNTLGDEVIAKLMSGRVSVNQWLVESDKKFDALFSRIKKK